MIIKILLILLIVVPWIWTFVDILKNEFTGQNKIIWLVLWLLLNALVIPFYFFIGRKQKIKQV